MARRLDKWTVGLFALALALRLLHLLTIRDSPYFSPLSLDPLAYDEWGRRIAGGAWLGDGIFYQDPLYPYFLGVCYKLLGHGYARVILIQMLFGALIPPLLYRASIRPFGGAAARATGLLAALYLPLIYYEGLILKTWLGAFLAAAALTAVAGCRDQAGRRWLVPGLLLGLGCLVRGNLLLFLPLLVAWMLLDPAPGRTVAWSRRLRDPGAWRSVAWLAAGVLLVLGPTALRNRAVGGEWVLTTAQGGQNFYIGNNPSNRNGRYEPLPFVGANPKFEQKGFRQEAERRLGRSMRPTEVSRYWLSESARWIRAEPGEWLRLLWRKLRNFFGAYEVPDNLDYYLYRDTAPILQLPLPGFGLIAPLALAGMWWSRRSAGWPRLLMLYTLVYAASVVLFFVFSRYRIPMMPALFPLAGFAMAEAWRRFREAQREGSWRSAAGSAAVLAVPFLFVNLPVHAPVDHWSYRLASTLHLPARPENSATGHYNLGLSYASQADAEAADPEDLLRRAEQEFREALRQDPRSVAPWAELGKVLARQRRDPEAIEVYRQVTALDPGKPRPHHVLGILHRRQGDLVAAEASFRTALRLAPRRTDSAVELGRVLLAGGRQAEAAEIFRSILQQHPDHAGARDGLRQAGAAP